MVKICQTGFLKLNFEIKQFYNRQKFLQDRAGCQAWVFIPQNVKKIQNLHPSLHFKTYKIMPIKYAILKNFL
jgi:hypothetical protein